MLAFKKNINSYNNGKNREKNHRDVSVCIKLYCYFIRWEVLNKLDFYISNSSLKSIP